MNADEQSGRADRDLAAAETVELTVLARQAGVKTVQVRRYLEFGLFEPHPSPAAGTPRFNPSSAARVARAERLRRDLGLNYAGAVLACELLDRISELEARPQQPSRGVQICSARNDPLRSGRHQRG